MPAVVADRAGHTFHNFQTGSDRDIAAVNSLCIRIVRIETPACHRPVRAVGEYRRGKSQEQPECYDQQSISIHIHLPLQDILVSLRLNVYEYPFYFNEKRADP